MLVLSSPRIVKNFDFIDTGDLETLVLPVFRIITPDIKIVRSERKRLNLPVPDVPRVGRLVVLQDDHLLHFGGIGKCLDICGI